MGIMGHAGIQTIKLNPVGSIVEMTMTRGPMKGSREIKLTSLDDGKKTRIDISWRFQFSGVPVFARPFIRSRIEGTTKEALERIARATEEKGGARQQASQPPGQLLAPARRWKRVG